MGYAIPSHNGQIITESYHPSTALRHGTLGSIVLRAEFHPLQGKIQLVQCVAPSVTIPSAEREQVIVDRCAGCQVHTKGWCFSGHFLLLPHLCVRVKRFHHTGQASLCILREVFCASAMNECFAACLMCRVPHHRHRLMLTAKQRENASHDYEGVRNRNCYNVIFMTTYNVTQALAFCAYVALRSFASTLR